MFNNFFFENHTVHEIMLNNTVEPDRPQMTIWCMRIACWVSRATKTQSEYVLLLVFHWNNGWAKAPRCYGLSTVPVLLLP
jgi:hypothetical protein